MTFGEEAEQLQVDALLPGLSDYVLNEEHALWFLPEDPRFFEGPPLRLSDRRLPQGIGADDVVPGLVHVRMGDAIAPMVTTEAVQWFIRNMTEQQADELPYANPRTNIKVIREWLDRFFAEAWAGGESVAELGWYVQNNSVTNIRRLGMHPLDLLETLHKRAAEWYERFPNSAPKLYKMMGLFFAEVSAQPLATDHDLE